MRYASYQIYPWQITAMGGGGREGGRPPQVPQVPQVIHVEISWVKVSQVKTPHECQVVYCKFSTPFLDEYRILKSHFSLQVSTTVLYSTALNTHSLIPRALYTMCFKSASTPSLWICSCVCTMTALLLDCTSTRLHYYARKPVTLLPHFR